MIWKWIEIQVPDIATSWNALLLRVGLRKLPPQVPRSEIEEYIDMHVLPIARRQLINNVFRKKPVFAIIVAALIASPAYAGGFGAGFGAGIGQEYGGMDTTPQMLEQQLYQNSLPGYYSPPVVEYHNYTFPPDFNANQVGRTLTCATYSNVTHCY